MGTNPTLIQSWGGGGGCSIQFPVFKLDLLPGHHLLCSHFRMGWVSNSTTQAMCSSWPFLLSIQGLQIERFGSDPQSASWQPKQAGSQHNLVFSYIQHSPRPSAGRITYLSSLPVGMNKKECRERGEALDKRWLKIAVTQSRGAA